VVGRVFGQGKIAERLEKIPEIFIASVEKGG
jgi:hypothetical protein